MAAPWPEFLIKSFLSTNQFLVPSTDENNYYGPYTRLLYHLFGIEGPYEIIPEYHIPIALPGDSINVVALFTVKLDGHPVLFIEVKEPASFRHDFARLRADADIRDRLLDIRGDIVIPHLPAISAFGTRLAFYDFIPATRAVTPPRVVANDPHLLCGSAPAEWWSCDLLEHEGAAQFRQVIDQVKAMCQALDR